MGPNFGLYHAIGSAVDQILPSDTHACKSNLVSNGKIKLFVNANFSIFVTSIFLHRFRHISVVNKLRRNSALSYCYVLSLQ